MNIPWEITPIFIIKGLTYAFFAVFGLVLASKFWSGGIQIQGFTPFWNGLAAVAMIFSAIAVSTSCGDDVLRHYGSAETPTGYWMIYAVDCLAAVVTSAAILKGFVGFLDKKSA